MTQSTFIAGALLAGFVLYVAAKGRLSTYTAVLWGPTSQPVPGAPTAKQAVTAGVLSTAGTAVSTVGKLLTGAELFGF